MSASDPKHPIGFVSRQTGLTPHVIRVWERRYGAVTPQRTDTNRRLYSDRDILRLKLLKAATARGHTISRVAELPDDELRAIASSGASVGELESDSAIAARRDELLARCKASIRGLERGPLENGLREASVTFSPPYFFEEFVAPLMRWIGDEWHDGTLGIAEEHFASASVQHALFEFAIQTSDDRLPTVVVCTPVGNHHEIGALLAAAAAVLEGWRPVYLGRDVPAREIARAALEQRALAVGMSVTYLPEPGALIGELQVLRKLIPEDIALIVGGEASNRAAHLFTRAGAVVVQDLASFRAALAECLSSAKTR